MLKNVIRLCNMYILVLGRWNEHLRKLYLNDRCAAFSRQSHKYKTWAIAINLSSYPVLRSGCCLWHLLELGKKTLICTSACCTPGGIRKSPLLTFSTALYCCCVLRQRVVHQVGSENPPYWHLVPHYNVVVSYVTCCTPDGIRRPHLLTFDTAFYYRCFLCQRVVHLVCRD